MKVHLLIIWISTLLLWLSPSFSSEHSFFNYTVKRVVLDAGHGGKDPGTSGKSVHEKDITLAITKKLGKYIEANFKDVEVLYTRRTDSFVELFERAALANRNNADLFISVHCNSASYRAMGTETYVMGIDKSRENLQVARRENAVVLLENDYQKKYDGFDLDNPENEIIFSLYQNAYLDQSIELAVLIEEQFKHRAKRQSRGVKQESFLVLYKTAMPSVLVETGFLSSQKEEKYLKTGEGQDFTASAIYRAFKQYKNQVEGNNKGYLIPTSSSSDNRGKSLDSDNADTNIKYKIQLYNQYESVNLGKPDFDVTCGIEIEEDERGIKSYMNAEDYNNYDKAIIKLMDVKEAGFKHARVVIYNNGERIIE